MPRFALVALIAFVSGGAFSTAFAAGEQVSVQDSIRSGLTTSPMLDSTPAGVRVTWINWDSGFRNTGLQIGDRVVAVDGKPIVKPPTLPELQRMLPKLVGQYAEYQGWAERGARDGTAVTLTVHRRSPTGTGHVTVPIKGKVLAERGYRNAENREVYGPGGPQRMYQNDGFDTAWSSWYEFERGYARFCERVLDDGFSSGRITSRTMLAELMESKPRIDFLLKRYPGPFSKAAAEDFALTLAVLSGTKYTVTPRELEYRQIGEKRAQQIAAEAKTARAAFMKAHAAELIEPFPAIDPIRDDRSKVAGKLIALPAISNRDWVMEADRCYMTSGQQGQGWYFIACDQPAMKRLMGARHRYQKVVTPTLAESYSIVGRIVPEPKMLVLRGRPTTGLRVELAAVTAGNDAMFVDLTQAKDGESLFAGEAALQRASEIAVPADASPRQVMEAFVEALKQGEEATWKGFFATWRAERWDDDGEVRYFPYSPRRSLESDFVRARRLVLGEVYGAKVVWVSEVRRVMTGKEFKGAPTIDEVDLEIDHIGLFDGEHRAFTSINVRRRWVLQRQNGGPWRITTEQAL